MKTNRISKIIFLLLICAIIFAAIFVNLKNFKMRSDELFDALVDKQYNNQQSAINSVETKIKKDLYFANQASDLNGFVWQLLQKRIVGHDEFFKDKSGKTNVYTGDFSSKKTLDSIIELKNVADLNNTNVVYMRMPNRITDPSDQIVSGYQFMIKQQQIICNTCEENGIGVLDLNQSVDHQDLDNYYFKTDVHATTYSEFISAKCFIDYIVNQYGLNFTNYDEVFDLNNYLICEYPFLGNTSRNTGRYFSGTDKFEIYHPKFSTNLLLKTSTGYTKSGDYDNVCLNGMESKPHTEYSYWVTNYMQYPNPYYEINNLALEDAPNILVITDSIIMRFNSFLSMLCGNITIVDPRTDDGFSVMRALNSHKYDVVLVAISDPAMTYTYFNSINYWSCSFSSEFCGIYFDGNNIDIAVKNTCDFDWTSNNCIRCQLLVNGVDCGIRAYILDDTIIKPGRIAYFRFSNMSELYANSITLEAQMLQESQRYFDEKITIK